jgi:hypothetical protein
VPPAARWAALLFGDGVSAFHAGRRNIGKSSINKYYCPVKNGIGKKAMLNGCKIAVE